MKGIPRSWLSPTIRVAAAGIGAAVGGQVGGVLGASFGGWLLDSLGLHGMEALNHALENLGEKATEKLFDTSTDTLIEKLGESGSDLQGAYREALRLSLADVRQRVSTDFASWFENWEACLAGAGELDLPPIRPEQLAAEHLNLPLRRALQALNMQGELKRERHPTRIDVQRTMPEPLLAALSESLPELLSHHLMELIVKTRYETGWRQMQFIVLMHLTSSFGEMAAATANIARKIELLDAKADIASASRDSEILSEIAAGAAQTALHTEALGELAVEMAACRRILENLHRAKICVQAGEPGVDAHPESSFRKLSSEDRAAILRGYLDWLVRSLRNLPNGFEIGNQRFELPLEEVYVAVRGFPGAITEIQQSQKLDEETPGAATEEPTVWQQRDRKLQFASLSLKTFDLAEAFREFATLIVLGDPGSGKTTLTRWLTLNFANAMLCGQQELLVSPTSVDSSAAPSESLVSLGRVRLPIYLRLADFAVYYKLHPHASLMEALAQGVELGRPLYPTSHPREGEPIETDLVASMMLEFLIRHQAAVFLDGLDEFTQPEDRAVAVTRIHGFIDVFMPRRSPSELPEGNRLLVTSRRVGYKTHPLRDQVRPFTVEDLSVHAIRRFSEAWHRACAKALSATSQSPPEFEATSASAGFLNQIFDPRRQALRDLSHNPLMLNLLCLVNFENQHKLPESRAELYELLVNRGFNRTFIDRERSRAELAPLLSEILIGVATHIHQTSSNGLIDRTALAGVIKDLVRAQGPRGALLGTYEQVFLLITGSAGLMAERGADKFGFRHLTIQEYLAGRGLVADSARAAALLLEKAPDPRWREAVLLGLGYLSEQASADTFEDVCSQMLDRAVASDTEQTPLGAMIIAEALGEVRGFSSETVGTALRQLLDAYTASLAVSEQREYRELVESTFSLLIRGSNLPDPWFVEAEQILIASLSGRSLLYARAAARIVSSRRLYLSSFAEPLLRALRSDCEEFGWVFTRSLQAMASCKVTSLGRRPARPDLLSQLESKTIATLADPKIVHSARIQLNAAGDTDRSVGLGIPTHLLSMRQALEHAPELTALIRDDLQWLRLMVGLYGGLGNFGALEIRRELAAGRSQIVSALIDSTTALEIAVYLDTALLPRWEEIKKRSIEFEPAFIYRESPLTPLLLAALRERTGIAPLRATLQQIWRDPHCDAAMDLRIAYEGSVAQDAPRQEAERHAEVHLLTDSIVALALLEVDLDLGSRGERTEQQRAAFAAARHQLESIRTSLDETLALCEMEARDLLRALVPKLGTAQPAASTALPRVDSGAIAETFPEPPSGQGALFAESIARIFVQLFSNPEADASHEAAVLIDTQGKLLTRDPAALIDAWTLINNRHDERWPRSVDRGIHVGPRASPIVHALAGLSAIPRRHHVIKGWLLRQFGSALCADGPAFPLALALAWSLRHQRGSFLDALAGVAPDLMKLSPEVYRSRVSQSIAALAPSDAAVAFWALRCLEPLSGRVESPWVSQLELLAQTISDERERLLAVNEVDLLKHADAPSPRKWVDPAEPYAEQVIAAVSRVIEGSGGAPVDTADLIKPGTKALSDVLTQYWRRIFLGYDDDAVYSLAVVLDTKGKDLSHDRAALTVSLARSIPIARALRWDHRVTILPCEIMGSPIEHSLLALLFLSLVPQRFQFFTSWSLGRLAPLLREFFLDLLPLAAAIAVELDDEHRQEALSRIRPDLAGMPHMEAIRLIEESLQTIVDPYVKFHTLRHLRKLSGNAAPVTVAVEWVKGIADADLRQQAMEMLFLEQPLELLAAVGAEGAVALIESLHDPARRSAVCQLLLASLPPDAGASLLAQLNATSSRLVGIEAREQLLLDGLNAERASQEESRIEVARWIESHAGDLASVKRTPLCTMTLALRLDYLLSVWELAEADPLLWQALVLEPDNESVYWQLLQRARAGKARLDADSIAAIQKLWADHGQGRRRLTAILPLIRASEAAGIAALQSWSNARDEDRFLSRWAALMLAERGFWSPPIVKHCVALLRGPSDLLKHRATLAIVRNEIGSNRMVRASVLGIETLEQMAREALANEKVQPSTTLKITWSFEGVVYDSVSHVERWIALLAANGKDALEAEYLLGAAHFALPAVTVRLLDILESDAPARPKIAVLRSFVHFNHTDWGKLAFSRAIEARLLSALRGLMRSSDKSMVRIAACVFGYTAHSAEDCRVLLDVAAHPDPDIQCAALHGLALMIERRPERMEPIADRIDAFLASPSMAVSAAAAHVLVRSGEPIERLSSKVGNDDTLLSALISGVDGYYENDWYRRGVAKAAQFIQTATMDYLERNPDGFGHALAKALGRLKVALPSLETGDGRSLAPSQSLCNILPVCAAAAELMPDTYLRVLRTQSSADFLRRLSDAACRQESFTGRRAALTLLSLGRQFTPHAAKAIESALSDVLPVQATAVETAARFLEIDSVSWDALERLLASPAECTVWTAARIILEIVNNESLSPEVREKSRQRAQKLLAHRLRCSDQRRLVCVLDGDSSGAQIHVVDWLDIILRNALYSLGAGHLAQVRDSAVPQDPPVELRVRDIRAQERREFRFLVPAAAANEPIKNQFLWVEKKFNGSIHHELTAALASASEVATRNGVSCAELIQLAVRRQTPHTTSAA